VLKTRRVGGEDVLILRRPTGGTFPVPAEWTDRANPTVTELLGRDVVHDFDRLGELATLIKVLDEAARHRLPSSATNKIDHPRRESGRDRRKT
jgi:hypothetical protein